MKKDSDELFQLITALTPAEKRYCSLYLKKNASGDDNRYLALFNYLKDAGTPPNKFLAAPSAALGRPTP